MKFEKNFEEVIRNALYSNSHSSNE